MDVLALSSYGRLVQSASGCFSFLILDLLRGIGIIMKHCQDCMASVLPHLKDSHGSQYGHNCISELSRYKGLLGLNSKSMVKWKELFFLSYVTKLLYFWRDLCEVFTVYMCRSQWRMSGILFCHCPTYSFELVSGYLTKFGDKLVGKKKEWVSFLSLPHPLTVLGLLTNAWLCLACYMGSGNLNSVPHSYAARTPT